MCIRDSHVADEIQQLVAVTPLVVVPGNQLHKVIVQHDAGLEMCIRDRLSCAWIALSIFATLLTLDLGTTEQTLR